MASRTDVRQLIARLLPVYYTGFQQVWAYQCGDFQQQTPVAEVTSAGTLRERVTARGTLPKPFYIDITVYALYSDQAGTYTEEDAEDVLDAAEAAVDAMVVANPSNALWMSIGYADRSQVLPNFLQGGVVYRREVIRLQVVGRQ